MYRERMAGISSHNLFIRSKSEVVVNWGSLTGNFPHNTLQHCESAFFAAL